MIHAELEKIAVVYGDVCVRKKKERRKRQKLLILELFFEYAKNSTLHGFRYIVDQGLTIIERLFWFLTVIGSFLLCLFYIYNVIVKWKTSPVIVTMNERLASVSSVPFPSVTICPQNKINPNRLNYTEILAKIEANETIKEDEFQTFRHVNFLCDSDLVRDYESMDDFWNVSAVNDIMNIAPHNGEIFYFCAWQSKGCMRKFTKTLTQDGVCYTINNLAEDDIFEDTVQQYYQYMESDRQQEGWSIEKGYNNTHNDTFYPGRGRVNNLQPDLAIILKHDPENFDKTCNNIFSGYKIYLHHPADYPQSSLYYYAAIKDQLSSVAISFHELNSDSSLVDYDPKIRQCYFPKDRKLRYFKIYTATNCQAECLSNYTYKICNCVAFYMPHYNHSEICNFYNNTNRGCVHKAKNVMAVNESNEQIPDEDKCRCLPACNTVEYDAEILKTEFQMQDFLKKYNDYLEMDIFDSSIPYSRVELFYKKPQFVTMQRRELFGFTDLLANIGGLLGVFLGFSFLSLVELLYFLSVRVGFILKRDLDEEKAREISMKNSLKSQ